MQFVGFLNQMDEYPAVVVPILQDEGKFYALYARCKKIELDPETSFVRIESKELFDPTQMNIFAYSETSIEFYSDDKKFFTNFFDRVEKENLYINPHYAITLAKRTDDFKIIKKYFDMCLLKLMKASPKNDYRFVEMWFDQTLPFLDDRPTPKNFQESPE